MSTSTGAEQRPQPSPRRPRARQNAWDMVRSLGALALFLVPVLLLVPRPTAVEQPRVDVAATAVGASSRASFDLPAPALPSGWRPTSARLESPGPDGVPTWHVGWVTPSGAYAGLEVAASATGRWLSEVTASGEQVGTQDVDGTSWQAYSASDAPAARRSLVLAAGGVTTVVVGGAPAAELVDLASAVQDAPAGT